MWVPVAVSWCNYHLLLLPVVVSYCCWLSIWWCCQFTSLLLPVYISYCCRCCCYHLHMFPMAMRNDCRLAFMSGLVAPRSRGGGTGWPLSLGTPTLWALTTLPDSVSLPLGGAALGGDLRSPFLSAFLALFPDALLPAMWMTHSEDSTRWREHSTCIWEDSTSKWDYSTYGYGGVRLTATSGKQLISPISKTSCEYRVTLAM